MLILFILAVIWVGLGFIATFIGGIFAWRTPERMGRKHPETIDPHTGQQRVLLDLSQNSPIFSEGHARRRPINRARKWAFRARRHL